MVSKTLPSFKSILELFLSSSEALGFSLRIFLGSVSCNSSSFNSQKSRVLLSSRCLIFKVLALSISFSLSASLERLTILPHLLQFVKHFFRIFFRGLFRSPVRFRFSAVLFRVFRALSRALRYYTAPSLKCQHLFSCFFKFLFSHCILCLFLFYIPGLPCFLETGANLSGRKSPFLGELTLIGGTGFAYI